MKTQTLLLLGVGGLVVYSLAQRRQAGRSDVPMLSLDEITAGLMDWQTNGWGTFGDSWGDFDMRTDAQRVADDINDLTGWSRGGLGSL